MGGPAAMGDFFRPTGIRVLRGRGFLPSDTAASPVVAIINETGARYFFEGDDPVGKIVQAAGGLTQHAELLRACGSATGLRLFEGCWPSRVGVLVFFHHGSNQRRPLRIN